MKAAGGAGCGEAELSSAPTWPWGCAGLPRAPTSAVAVSVSRGDVLRKLGDLMKLFLFFRVAPAFW